MIDRVFKIGILVLVSIFLVLYLQTAKNSKNGRFVPVNWQAGMAILDTKEGTVFYGLPGSTSQSQIDNLYGFKWWAVEVLDNAHKLK